MTDTTQEPDEKPFAGLEPISDTKIGTSMGIAAIALNMAMKYHDIGIVKDGAMYQQYKLEGRNLQPLQLDTVFETAMQIELNLLSAERRITELVASAIVEGLEREAAAEEAASKHVENSEPSP